MSTNKRKLFRNPAVIVTADTNGINFKRGRELKEIYPLTAHSIIAENEKIIDIIPDKSVKNPSSYEIINLSGRTVLPGLVESHTHTAFAGSRAGEFKKKLAGVSYEEIALAGGGILTTVKAVREISEKELINIIKPRIQLFISQGITTLEIKSGYGLNFDAEIKLLNIINKLRQQFPIDIIPTFLGAHTFPPEYKNDHDGYINLINERMLPFISDNNLAVFCDAFCETTAFSAEETDRIFSKANSLGLGIKMHTDQFNSIGGIDIALKHNAVSIDHLEVIPDSYINLAGETETVFTLLPGVSFFLNHVYAPARKLLEKNAIVSLATDYNPGSSNIINLHLIMSIAALKMKMTIEEVISAVTINSAKALNMHREIGSIEPGKKADFAVFDTEDYADIIYNIGHNLNIMTIKNGNIIYDKTGELN